MISSSQNEQYNIITGAILQKYPLKPTSKRFSSTDLNHNRVDYNKQKLSNKQFLKTRKLGTPKDYKMFIYRYNDNEKLKQINLNQQKNLKNTEQSKYIKPNQPQTITQTMVNYSKLGFNIINHTSSTISYFNLEDSTNKLLEKSSVPYRRSPVSKFTDLARLYAPNYSQQFKKLENKFTKKKQMCGNLCEIEKSYGLNKYFRRFK